MKIVKEIIISMIIFFITEMVYKGIFNTEIEIYSMIFGIIGFGIFKMIED